MNRTWQRHPWELWADQKQHVITQDTDFEGSLNTMRIILHNHARRSGQRVAVRTLRYPYESLVFRFYPRNAAAPRLPKEVEPDTTARRADLAAEHGTCKICGEPLTFRSKPYGECMTNPMGGKPEKVHA